VVLAPERPKDWYTIAESENIFFVAGSALSLFDLERSAFKSASAIFLSKANVPKEMSDPSIVDAEGIFASRLIESQIPDPNIQVISELVFDSNYVFNPVGLGAMEEKKLDSPSPAPFPQAIGSQSSWNRSQESLPDPTGSSPTGKSTRNGNPREEFATAGQSSKGDENQNKGASSGGGGAPQGGQKVRAGGILGQMVNAKGKELSSPSAQGDAQGDEGGKGRSEMLSQIETSDYFRQARFASGQLFVSSLVTSLVVNTLFNPSLALLVQEMVSAQVVLAAAPKEYVGKSYLELFKCLLLKQNLVAMGLYRRSESFAHDLGHPRTRNSKVLDHFYMFTAPPAKDTIVKATDRVLCIAMPRKESTSKKATHNQDQ
jgi:hypothetical protein